MSPAFRTSIVGTICWTLIVINSPHDSVFAADDAPASDAPILRVLADGPLAAVTALGFREDPETRRLILQAASLDKAVHAWVATENQTGWKYDPDRMLRVPIGRDYFGSLSAMAISDDGAWLAVGGRGRIAGLKEEHEEGRMMPVSAALSVSMWQDLGAITVFELSTGAIHQLRGHSGAVQELAFAPGTPSVLVSASVERQPDGTESGKIRVWDVANNRQLASLPQLPADTARKPKLAVLRVGPEANDLLVAIAWSERNSTRDRLRVWDVAAGKLAQVELNAGWLAIASFPQQRTVLAATSQEFGLWTLPAGSGARLGTISTQQHYRRIAPLPAVNNVTQPPIALTTIPRPDGPAKFVAGITLTPRQLDCRLVVADIQTQKLVADLPLWKLSSQLPALAVDPRGEHLAISGNDPHEIWVLRLEDVLAQRVQNRQVLRSAAHVIRSVSFVRENDRLGLELGSSVERSSPERQKTPSKRLVFDVARRELTAAKEWQAFNAPPSTWQVTSRTQQERLVLDVRERDRLHSSVMFDRGNVLDVWTICPPTAALNRTLLAAAVRQARGSQIWLIDARTGERLSILTGVADQVTSLAFSGDGLFLTAASLENIARIWWLADLAEPKPFSGVLEGLAIKLDDQGRLVVREDTSGVFASDDVLSFPGPDPAQPPRRFESESEFYEWVAEKRPGESLAVDVTGRDGRRRRVVAKVQRAIDARGPLCSLFVFADRNQRPADWVCWDPLGRYDSPREEAESRLGWHFNLEEAPGQVRFVTAAKYRDQNFRKGLLQDHLQQGPVLLPAVLPEPETMISLRQGQLLLKAPADGPVIAQGDSLAAFVQISHLPPQTIASVEGEIAGESYSFTEAASGVWEADLTGIPANRELQTLSIQIKTTEQQPRTFLRTVSLRRLPLPPTITLEPDVPERADQEQLELSVGVTSPAFERDEVVELVVRQMHAGNQVQEQSWQATGREGHTLALKLRPGQNVITVAARHRGALPDLASFESAQRKFTIRLSEPQRPELEITGVSSPGDDAITPLPVDPSWLTDRTEITVHGRATVAKPDQIEQVALLMTTAAQEDKKPEAERVKVAADGGFQHVIRFNAPGRRRITLTAKTNRGVVDEAALDVDVRPALPALSSAKLTAGERELREDEVLIEGRDSSDMTLRAGFAAVPADRVSSSDTSVAVRLKHGDAVEEVVTKLSATQPDDLQHRFTLQQGVTEVSLILRNPETERTLLTERLIYRRPPRILRVEHPQAIDVAMLPFSAVISSWEQPTVRVEQNGVKVSAELLPLKNDPDDPALWQLKAELPLDLTSKRTRLVLSAENRDGVCLAPHESTVTYRPPPPPIPEIRTEFPALIRTQDSSLLLKFRVRSTTPLKSIRLVIDAGPDRTIPIDTDSLPPPNRDGFISLEQELSLDEIGVPLFRLSLEAVNAAGLARSRPTEVNYVAPPVPLVIDGLGTYEGKSLASRGTRWMRFADASEAELVLKGHLAKRPGRRARVKVWVNGFLQNSVATDQEGRFSIPVLLNLPKENRISFELPDLPVDEMQLPRLAVDCRAHVRPAVLRLVVVLGTEGSDRNRQSLEPKAMEQMITQALKARNPQVQGFKMEPGIVLSGNFTKHDVDSVLTSVALLMRPAKDRPVNDVLVMYYRGKETLIGDADFELSTGNPRTPIDRRTLISWFRNIPGAHLVLLDVASQPVKRLAERLGKSDDRLGLLRVAWSEPNDENGEPSLLISSLERVIQTSPEQDLNLQKAVLGMADVFQSLRQDLPELAFDYSIPEDLQRLVLVQFAP